VARSSSRSIVIDQAFARDLAQLGVRFSSFVHVCQLIEREKPQSPDERQRSKAERKTRPGMSGFAVAAGRSS